MAERAASADAGDTRTSDAELASLRSQLQREREEKDAARAEADTARRERDDVARRLTGEVDQRFTAEEQHITDSLAAANTEADSLQVRVAELNEKGEFTEAAKVVREMARIEARVSSLEQRKESLAGAKENAKRNAAAVADRASKDPLYGLTEPAKAWIRRHPLWMTDKAYQDRVTAAHYKAKADGIQVDSERYFRFIETEIGERKADDDGRRQDDGQDRRQARDRQDGGRADADSPLSGAADLQDAGNGEVVIEDEPGVEVEGGEDLYNEAESAVRRAQERARERSPAERQPAEGGRRERASRTSSAAPPSRGGSPAGGTRPRQQGDGRTRLTAVEAEVALMSYPPGEHPGIKTKEDAYRAYHAQKMSLDADGRLGTRRT